MAELSPEPQEEHLRHPRPLRQPSPPPQKQAGRPNPGTDVTIVFVGQSGAGKSTLINGLLNDPKQERPSSRSVTTRNRVQRMRAQEHGVTLEIYDTVGLEGDPEENQKLLQDLSKSTGNRADLVVFCIPVQPGARFNICTPGIMDALLKAYGKEVWKHCIFAFTFSNNAWRHFEEETKTSIEVIKKYKDYIQEFTDDIQKKLTRMGVTDVIVKTPFNQNRANQPGAFLTMAISAGYRIDDKVLPGIKLDPKEQWKGYLFLQMAEHCRKEKRKKLLTYRYEKESIVKAILKSMGIGTAVSGAGVGAFGAVVGAMEGAAAGAVAGPAGMLVGGALGAAKVGAAGILVGTVYGAPTVGVGFGVITGVKKVISDYT